MSKQIPDLIVFFKKAWKFIWHDDSLLSWIANIILAFVLIKFIVYPAIGFIFGTSLPVVAVISESMEHDGSFDSWWDQRGAYYENIGFSSEEFRDFPLKNGFNKGDIIVLYGTNFSDLAIGDVIVFQANRPYPIIHRVIKINDVSARIVETKGDHNPYQIKNLDLDETHIESSQYLGRGVFRIPFVGYVKIWFVKFLDLFGLGALFS